MNKKLQEALIKAKKQEGKAESEQAVEDLYEALQKGLKCKPEVLAESILYIPTGKADGVTVKVLGLKRIYKA